MLSVSRLHVIGWRDDWLIGKDLEGSGRGLKEMILRHLTGEVEKNHEIFLTIAGFVAENLIQLLPSAYLEPYKSKN
jgi:hypothetical protein